MERPERADLRGSTAAGLLACAAAAFALTALATQVPFLATSLGAAGGVALFLAGRSSGRVRPGDARMRALLRSTLESTTDGILTVDLQGHTVSHNQRFVDLWRLVPGDAQLESDDRIARVLDRLVDPDTFVRRIEELRRSPEASGTDLIEFRDGRVLHRGTMPHWHDGRIVGRVFSFRDITEQRRAEQALAESERRFRRMATNVPGVIYQFYVRRDNTLWFTYLSEGAHTLLGVEPSAFPWRADALVERVHPDDMQALREAVARSSVAMEPWTWEGRLLLGSSERRWLRAASRPTRLPDGKVTWDGLLMDVTVEKAATEALHRREEQLAEAQQIARVGSWDWNLATGDVAVSPEHWRIFGYEPRCRPWSVEAYLAAIHPGDRQRVVQLLERSLATGTTSSADYRIIRPDGSERFISSRGKIIRDGTGTPVRIVGTAQDVTDRHDAAIALEKRVRMEQALTRAARTLSAGGTRELERVLELISRAIGADRASLLQRRADADTPLMDCTHEWRAEKVPSAASALRGFDPDSTPWWTARLLRGAGVVVNSPEELPAEAVAERALMERSGALSTVAVPLLSGPAGLIGFLTCDHVTTGRTWSEEDVRALQTTAEIVVAHFSRVKAEKEVQRREGILQAVSFAAERFLRTHDWEAGLDEAVALIGGAAGVGRAYLYRMELDRCGEARLAQRAEWTADGVAPHPTRRAAGFRPLGELGIGRWEESLRAREPLQAIVSTLPQPERARLGEQGIRSILLIPIHVGEEWWGVLGMEDCQEEREWSATEMEALATAAGMVAAAVQRNRSEDALRESDERFRQMAESMRDVFFLVSADGSELVYLSPSFEEVWGRKAEGTEAFLAAIHPDDRSLVLADIALSRTGRGDPLRFVEYRICRPDGSIRWIRHRTFQIYDELGRPYRVTGVCSDITEQRQLEEELRRANRIEAIGHLAAGIAHEINTPIQYVGDNVRFLDASFADLRRALDAYAALLREASSGEVTPERIAQVANVVDGADLEYLLEEAPRASAQALDGVTRVAEIVRAMKEFSHPGSGRKVPTDLNQAICSTITVARNEWKYIADLVTDLDETLPLVSCHPGQFNQAILNLVVNAAHAIADRQQTEGGAERGTIIVRTAAAAGVVEICISDTGTGIPEAIRDRVFDPFFTTKDVGRGTGQGLTFVHSIVVEKHGGTIGFESEPGVGTTFVLRLPVVEPATPASEAA